MKKTLAAVAVLGAFAGSALAADVTLYGKVDLGLQYVHSEKSVANAADAAFLRQESDDWGLKSGSGSASRWGIKGTEQISEGLTVGFMLEDGIDADNGKTGDMFDREARLFVTTEYGTLHMGRFGGLDATVGSVSVVGSGKLSAMGGGYGSAIADHGIVLKKTSRFNNAIAYTSPVFAGVKVSAMAALGDDISGTVDGETVTFKEGSSDVDRYYALGLNGQWGAFGAALAVSQMDFGHTKIDEKKAVSQDKDNSTNVTAGVNYDFGVAKAYLAGNYYDDGDKLDQYGVLASVSAPLAGGTLQVQGGYKKVSDDSTAYDNEEGDTMMIGAYYEYPLSKRTYIYTSAGYTQVDYDNRKGEFDSDKTTEVVAGIVHNF